MQDVTGHRVGESALLLQTPDLASTLRLAAALREDPPAGVLDLVPAARTVLVRFDGTRTSADALLRHAGTLDPAEDVARAPDPVRLPVTYDGEDLDEVARLTGLSRGEVVARHTAARYRVAFTGFAPGFAYLAGGDPALVVPRRATPRTRVPAGAVGLAGEFSGVYPRASPGGWRLLGRTDVLLWDLTRQDPALLTPGTEVEFLAVGPRAVEPLAVEPRVAASWDPQPAATPDRSGRSHAAETGLEVVHPGPLTLFTDDGRPGLAHLGVGVSGAADRGAARAANRLLGNDSGAPVLEVTLGGLVVRSRGRQVVALTGADPGASRELPSGVRVAVPVGVPAALDDGDLLVLGPVRSGVRTYLAVRGGFDVPLVLGSAARDVLAGLGPEPPAAGDVLAVRPAPTAAVTAPAADRAAPVGGPVTLRVVPGPRADWFDDRSRALLTAREWTVDARSDRVGTRLTGAEPLRRERTGELPSEGLVRGAVQVPPDGHPVLFGPDHPLTGGYPVVACVVDADLDLTAQLAPGTRVRFTTTTDRGGPSCRRC